MSESEPGREEQINLAPLRRFHSDMHYANGFFDLYNGLTTYLSSEFDISEEAAKQLYDQMSDHLPGAELYDADVDMAQEQMRLSLMRVVLPLMEDMVDSEEQFIRWTVASGTFAMDVLHGVHRVEDCVEAPRGKTEFGCQIGPNCPVKVTKHILINDCMMPDFNTFDYHSAGAERKINRTLSKLSAAERLGLVVGHETATIKNTYLLRCQIRELPTPELGDI